MSERLASESLLGSVFSQLVLHGGFLIERMSIERSWLKKDQCSFLWVMVSQKNILGVTEIISFSFCFLKIIYLFLSYVPWCFACMYVVCVF